MTNAATTTILQTIINVGGISHPNAVQMLREAGISQYAPALRINTLTRTERPTYGAPTILVDDDGRVLVGEADGSENSGSHVMALYVRRNAGTRDAVRSAVWCGYVAS